MTTSSWLRARRARSVACSRSTRAAWALFAGITRGRWRPFSDVLRKRGIPSSIDTGVERYTCACRARALAGLDGAGERERREGRIARVAQLKRPALLLARRRRKPQRDLEAAAL